MISNRELAKHIYRHIISTHGLDPNDPIMIDIERDTINYVSNLIQLNNEPENHLGSKGFIPISREQDYRDNFGC
jgi:hypothetical protein